VALYRGDTAHISKKKFWGKGERGRGEKVKERGRIKMLQITTSTDSMTASLVALR